MMNMGTGRVCVCGGLRWLPVENPSPMEKAMPDPSPWPARIGCSCTCCLVFTPDPDSERSGTWVDDAASPPRRSRPRRARPGKAARRARPRESWLTTASKGARSATDTPRSAPTPGSQPAAPRWPRAPRPRSSERECDALALRGSFVGDATGEPAVGVCRRAGRGGCREPGLCRVRAEAASRGLVRATGPGRSSAREHPPALRSPSHLSARCCGSPTIAPVVRPRPKLTRTCSTNSSALHVTSRICRMVATRRAIGVVRRSGRARAVGRDDELLHRQHALHARTALAVRPSFSLRWSDP